LLRRHNLLYLLYIPDCSEAIRAAEATHETNSRSIFQSHFNEQRCDMIFTTVAGETDRRRKSH